MVTVFTLGVAGLTATAGGPEGAKGPDRSAWQARAATGDGDGAPCSMPGSAQGEDQEAASQPWCTGSDAEEEALRQQLAEQPLEQLVEQLIMLEYNTEASSALAELQSLLESYELGGFVLEDETSSSLFLEPGFSELADTRQLGDVTHPFVSVNEEGGPVQFSTPRYFDPDNDLIGCTTVGPIPGYTSDSPIDAEGWTCPDHSWAEDVQYVPYLRNAHSMPTTWTRAQTREQLAEVGDAMDKLGLNLTLAPVLGVSDGTSESSLLGDRTFADDPQTVERYARAFSRGVGEGSQSRVKTVVKHFPGLGTVATNTDDSTGVSAPLSELETRDLLPYDKSITDYYEASGVMMSNAAVPGLTCSVDAPTDECTQPATLTPAAYELLRGKYNWNGMVITDTLQTSAVLQDGLTIDQAAREAFAAGADLVEVKPTPDSAGDPPTLAQYEQTIDEVRSEIIAWVQEDPYVRRGRVVESVLRIVQAKSDPWAEPAQPTPGDVSYTG